MVMAIGSAAIDVDSKQQVDCRNGFWQWSLEILLELFSIAIVF
jgi:hypothetical protein